MALDLVAGTFAICRLEPDSAIPDWALSGRFCSISKSADELSVVCEDTSVPDDLDCERGWRALRVAGPLDMELIGVLAALALPLAKAKVSLFAVSTYDTDYVLIRDRNLERALEALSEFGHVVEGPARRERKPRAEIRRDERPPCGDEMTGKHRRRTSARDAEAPATEHRRWRSAQPDAETPQAETPPAEIPQAETPHTKSPQGEVPQDETPQAERSPAWERRVRPARTKPPAARPTTRDEAPPRRVPLPGFSERREETAQRETPPVSPPASPPPAASLVPPADEPSPTATRRGGEDVSSEGLYTGAIPQHEVETTDLPFTALGLSDPILKTVREVGFVHPTPIQAGVIPEALEGNDIIGLAETGSGKTAAFSLPLAERLTHGRGIRGLILCPTREIALQTKAFLDIFGRDHHLDTVVVIGGVRMSPQIRGLKDRPDIIVATPGRLADHLRRRNVRLNEIEHLVLDEADHMLDLGFLPQIKEILEQVPDRRQTMMFSATMPPPIERLTQQFMHDPVRVDFRPKGHAAAGIEHRVYLVNDDDDRRRCLYQLLRDIEGSTLVFVRRKLHTEWLARQLELAGFPVERIHSDRSQGQRVSALRGFREGEHQILVATDVAARGIDVPGIRHVINFGFPEAVEDYVHRAGRTARGAAKGIVSSIGTWQDKETVGEIEATLGQKLARHSVEGVDAYVELKPRRTVRRRRLL